MVALTTYDFLHLKGDHTLPKSMVHMLDKAKSWGGFDTRIRLVYVLQ